MRTTYSLLLSLLLLFASCTEDTPAGPDWGDYVPTPEPEKPEEFDIKNIEPTTEVAQAGSQIAGLRFYPGISINIEQKNFNARLADIASAGFKYIEITIKHSYGIKDKSDDTVLAAFSTVLSQVKAAGLTVWSIHLPFEDKNWTNPGGSENIRRQSVDYLNRVMRLCAAGFPECKNYVLHASKGVLSPRSESVSQARKSLNEMIPVAKELGVRICVENLVGSLCPTTEEMASTIDGVKDVWVTYDIGHAHCVGQDVVDFLKWIGPRLGTVHIHDTMFASKDDSHSLIGDGNIGKWEEVYLTMLKDNRYRGVFLFELSGANAMTVMNSYKKIVDDYQKAYNQ